MAFLKLARRRQQRESKITEAMKDAHMLPTGNDLNNILRYEAALENQLERRVQQLIAWRRAREGKMLEGPLSGDAIGPPKARPVETPLGAQHAVGLKAVPLLRARRVGSRPGRLSEAEI